MLTPNKKRSLRRLWRGDLTNDEICDELGFTKDQLEEARVLLDLPEREEPDVYVPTQEEIRMACARIRSSWSQSTREQRIAHQSIRYGVE